MKDIQVFDNVVSPHLVRSAAAVFPDQHWPFWHRYNGVTANKFGSMDRVRIPQACQAVLDCMAIFAGNVLAHTRSFIDYDLHAAGMHMIPPGGFLARHLDAERHPLRPWRRTHSIVMFLNEEWSPAWGGELHIDEYGGIPPKFGRMVVFTTAENWHQVVPVSLKGDYRKTLALFAWESDKSAGGVPFAFFQDGSASPSHDHVKSP